MKFFHDPVTRKGFTLIELLVVIAIIGILSSIVLASLSRARNKGADAAIKSNLNTVRVQAEMFYEANGTYGSNAGTGCPTTAADPATQVFNQATVVNAMNAATEASSQTGETRCVSSRLAGWAALVELRESDPVTGYNYWCVDYMGNAKARINVSISSSVGCDL